MWTCGECCKEGFVTRDSFWQVWFASLNSPTEPSRPRPYQEKINPILGFLPATLGAIFVTEFSVLSQRQLVQKYRPCDRSNVQIWSLPIFLVAIKGRKVIKLREESSPDSSKICRNKVFLLEAKSYFGWISEKETHFSRPLRETQYGKMFKMYEHNYSNANSVVSACFQITRRKLILCFLIMAI